MGRTESRALEMPSGTGFVHGLGVTMQSLNALAAEIARTDIPVLLWGESGTGKDVYARLIHRLSVMNGCRLEKLNCAALDAGRLLTQIQDALRTGIENGDHVPGTLFLDGLDELDLTSQRVLLSLLPDGEPKSSDGQMTPRCISSTTRNLEKEIESGRFRRELYFRINGACLRLPALRERKEDIPELAEYFLTKYGTELNKQIPALNSDAMECLISYDWPGNIRELENVAKKIVALGDTRVALRDLRAAPVRIPETASSDCGSSLKVAARAASRRTERELILKALDRTHWNRKRAAQELQISYKSLLYKIKQIGVQGSAPDEVKGWKR